MPFLFKRTPPSSYSAVWGDFATKEQIFFSLGLPGASGNAAPVRVDRLAFMELRFEN
jgi:hypothetical protein